MTKTECLGGFKYYHHLVSIPYQRTTELYNSLGLLSAGFSELSSIISVSQAARVPANDIIGGIFSELNSRRFDK